MNAKTLVLIPLAIALVTVQEAPARLALNWSAPLAEATNATRQLLRGAGISTAIGAVETEQALQQFFQSRGLNDDQIMYAIQAISQSTNKEQTARSEFSKLLPNLRWQRDESVGPAENLRPGLLSRMGGSSNAGSSTAPPATSTGSAKKLVDVLSKWEILPAADGDLSTWTNNLIGLEQNHSQLLSSMAEGLDSSFSLLVQKVPTYTVSDQAKELLQVGTEFLQTMAADTSGFLARRGDIDGDVVTAIIERLSRGVIGVPTETVWALRDTMRGIMSAAKEDERGLKAGVDAYFTGGAGKEESKQSFIQRCRG